MSKPLTEVVREMSELLAARGLSPFARARLEAWSAAIADHLAQLEALADEWEGLGEDAWHERYRTAVHTCSEQIRALLSPAVAAASATEGSERCQNSPNCGREKCLGYDCPERSL